MFILCITDIYNKYTSVTPLKDTTFETIVKAYKAVLNV